MLEINAADLGTLTLEGLWAPYIDMVDADFLPTRLKLGADEYGFESSIIVSGHSAVLPGRLRALRESGKKALIAEREDRYYVFVSPP
jgi:hypothetical protein